MFKLSFMGSIFFILVMMGAPVAAAQTYSYSIMHLSDTQYLSESYPDTLNDTFSYLESQKNALNLSAIIVTGDLVNDDDDLNQWIHYIEARSRTTIPVYEVPGDEDLNQNEDHSLFNEFIGEKVAWTAVIDDFVFIGLGYSNNSLSDADIANYRSFILSNPQKFTLVATHNYYNKDYTVSLLGDSIRDNLILKPTIVMSGHVHDSFIKTELVGNIPFIVDLTNYQDYGDFSAGKLYTVYVTDGNVTKIAVREVYIHPYRYYYPERIVYQAPIEYRAPEIYPTQPPAVNPDSSPSEYPTKSPMVYSVGSLPLSPEKAAIINTTISSKPIQLEQVENPIESVSNSPLKTYVLSIEANADLIEDTLEHKLENTIGDTLEDSLEATLECLLSQERIESHNSSSSIFMDHLTSAHSGSMQQLHPLQSSVLREQASSASSGLWLGI
jgi:predicted MPP superfamily phosphohydrolase